ncbi:MAG: hypothetical protein C4576_21610 [Desulfobacteraceae bacterium]|nr:MAG: hypothetical protein C4576_21610 [Desulfobacteraceae bacterium]
MSMMPLRYILSCYISRRYIDVKLKFGTDEPRLGGEDAEKPEYWNVDEFVKSRNFPFSVIPVKKRDPVFSRPSGCRSKIP